MRKLLASILAFLSLTIPLLVTAAPQVSAKPASTLNANTPLEVLNSQATAEIRPSHTGYHMYSRAKDTRYWGSIVGHTNRKSELVTKVYEAGCTGPIYQTRWVRVNGPGNSWVEQGTAHWCDGSRSWFGFYAVDYNPSAPVGTLNGGIWAYNIPITGTTTHVHTSIRDGGNCALWNLYIDDWLVTQANIGGCFIGLQVEVGLESYTRWVNFDGPGVEFYDQQTLLWNGLPGGYFWVPWYVQSYHTDQEMFGRLTRPVPNQGWNGWAACENVASINCG